eukprot:TRINITY_DN3405_c0_g1_i3.p1 TRINITY_DN3405_c0_g1~~TRINITY_DN3405_c0_g1_i3.p1  ORF type:complete len:117 (+),score=29.55 TRINITY_DN3405_c0_g1_i3:15-365(+)
MSFLSNLRQRAEPKEEENEGPIDTDEQLNLVNSLRKENEASNRTFKRIFLFFTLSGCLMKAYAILVQILFPWTFLFHMSLYGVVSSYEIIISELLSGKRKEKKKKKKTAREARKKA